MATGFGMRNVDPSPEELATNRIFLGGYGALGIRGAATGVNDPIEAQAFYIESEGVAYAHVVLDVVGMGNKVSSAIREAAALRTGMPATSIMVGSTHTHCGPDFQGLWAGVTESYQKFVVDRSVEAIVEAYSSKQEAELFVSSTTPNGGNYNRNRRAWGWAINTTSVLDVRAVRDGSRLGVVVNFAAHPVTLGMSVREASGDYIGFAREYTRDVTGGQVVFVTGAIGDVSPGASTGSGFERARSFGKRIAELTISTLESDQRRVSPGLTVLVDSYKQTVTNPVIILAWLAGLMDAYYTMEVVGDQLSVETSVNYVRLGNEAEAVTFPGESLSRNAEPLQTTLLSKGVAFLFGLTQDSLGYLVPTDEWQTGRNNDYEETVSMDRLAGDQARDRLFALIRAGRGETAAGATEERRTGRAEARASAHGPTSTSKTGALDLSSPLVRQRIRDLLGKSNSAPLASELLARLSAEGHLTIEDF
eukprot:CAMPEP_0205825696 /NCGR_PEP_ID=MMETSP0206-20130828/26196_1 /ASSEMBLY_ACC=CAM_ASM_000279 /TAXON_ID=36767 /ORGANISM="Euplotes focardii, Strain TN1" /LENGTH=476 /DNA_ID=CAMNT_0053124959 /DNA_START=69 /DNA_END=1500 /DNA_ORIENTATION=+